MRLQAAGVLQLLDGRKRSLLVVRVCHRKTWTELETVSVTENVKVSLSLTHMHTRARAGVVNKDVRRAPRFLTSKRGPAAPAGSARVGARPRGVARGRHTRWPRVPVSTRSEHAQHGCQSRFPGYVSTAQNSTRARTRMHTHAHTRACTRACTHMHTQACMCTHTHDTCRMSLGWDP